MMTQQRQKCIRSMRIARQLMARGFQPIDVEEGRKSKGFIVFVFESTKELSVALDEIMGGRNV